MRSELEHKFRDFASALLRSISFVHFLDGYIEDQITNFDIVNSHLVKKRQLDRYYKL